MSFAVLVIPKDSDAYILRKEQSAMLFIPPSQDNIDSNRQNTRKKTTAEFIAQAKIVHGNKYSYEHVNYIGALQKVQITCPVHGIYLLTPNKHIRGQGCQECSMEITKLKLKSYKRTYKQEKIILMFRKKFAEKFDYSLAVTNGMESPIKIICPIHGQIEMSPAAHLKNVTGCVQCSREQLSEKYTIPTETWITRFKNTHGNKYDYSLVDRIENKGAKIKIICTKHGEFMQETNSHYQGHGCPRCARINASRVVSNISTQWLDSLNISNREFFIRHDKKYWVDGFDPETNTIYEFYGDYWHGNPKRFCSTDINPSTKKTFGEMYAETLEKEKVLLNLGYKLVTIWESDWIELLKIGSEANEPGETK